MLIRQFRGFEKLISIAALLGIYNVFYKFHWTGGALKANENLWNPVWLLFGPLLHFALQTLSGTVTLRKDWPHLLPAALTTALFAFVWVTTSFDHPWASISFVYYQNAYLVIPLSLYIYSYRMLTKLNSVKNSAVTDLLVISSALYIVIATLMVLMFLCWGVFHVNMGIDYRFFSYLMLLTMGLFVVKYLFSATTELELQSIAELSSPLYTNSFLRPELADNNKKLIMDCFGNTQIYLRPDFSLEMLSKELAIPKHVLTQMFTVHLKVNFYKFIAQYRVAYAIEKMKSSNGKLTIESLAYASGFNSKTSFNRYFKEITELTPQEFQQNYLVTQRKDI